jgi:hypothetical protein
MGSEADGIELILGAEESEGMLEGMLDGSELGDKEANETSSIALICYVRGQENMYLVQILKPRPTMSHTAHLWVLSFPAERYFQ